MESNTNKKILTAIILILLSIGMGEGFLILYSHLNEQNSKFSFISKQQALKTFWQSVNCTGTSEPRNGGVELVHVINDTRQYHVDESNMGDFALAFVLHPQKIGDDRYVWEVKGDCYYPDFHGTRAYVHYIDAKTGELLE